MNPDDRLDHLLETARRACQPTGEATQEFAQRLAASLHSLPPAGLADGTFISRMLALAAAIALACVLVPALHPANPYSETLDLANSTSSLYLP
jgi:hypothetical protein